MILDSRIENTINEYYSKIEEMLVKLAKLSYKEQEITIDFSIGNIKITVYGAEWQKEQFKKDYTDLCNGIVTAKGLAVKMAYDKGMADAKEQMMAKAVEGGCFSYKNGFVHISCDVDERTTNIKFGDKVKVIVIKEE